MQLGKKIQSIGLILQEKTTVHCYSETITDDHENI